MNVQQPLAESDLQTLKAPGQSAAPGVVRLPDGADVAAHLVVARLPGRDRQPGR